MEINPEPNGCLAGALRFFFSATLVVGALLVILA